MISLAVNMKRRLTSPHFPLAVHAFHEGLLILNPESHSSVSGTYAVMMARYSPLEAQGRKTRPDTHCVTQRCAPSVWGRLATCAAVGYRRRSAASAAVGRLPIGRSLPSCPTMPDLPLNVGTPFFMKFRGPKAHPNRPRGSFGRPRPFPT